MSERPKEVERFGDGQVRRKSVPGGWVVWCRLCDKSTRRSYAAALTNYAEAERASRTYAHQHLASSGHVAARDAYYSDEAPEQEEAERVLCAIFGKDPLTETELRRRAAKNAARREARRLRDEERPKCPICGEHVSTKAERKGDRVALPSGALVHARCV